MGNHDVGQALASVAEVFWQMAGPAPTKEQALAALETAGNRYRGADAEFDDHANPDEPLGRMIVLAFDAKPDELPDGTEDGWDRWYEGPYSRFRKHFDFC